MNRVWQAPISRSPTRRIWIRLHPRRFAPHVQPQYVSLSRASVHAKISHLRAAQTMSRWGLACLISVGLAHAQVITTIAGTGTDLVLPAAGAPAAGVPIKSAFTVTLDQAGNLYI